MVRVLLDGSSPELLLSTGLQNPNSVLADGDNVYILDSFFKSRKAENQDTFAPKQNGKLYKLQNTTLIEYTSLTVEVSVY